MQTSEQPVDISVKPEKLQGLDGFISSVMQDWQLPGLATAIVKDGEIVYARGFGKRNVAEDLDVTPHTLFPIGSCSKAFTTMILGMLVDEGKLDWDVPTTEKRTEITCTGYGLGWTTMSYRGHYRLSHSGGIDGFKD